MPPVVLSQAHATPGRAFSPVLATGRGRRRSSTPAGAAPPEAPPPPPTDSLFDSSAGRMRIPVLQARILQVRILQKRLVHNYLHELGSPALRITDQDCVNMQLAQHGQCQQLQSQRTCMVGAFCLIVSLA